MDKVDKDKKDKDKEKEKKNTDSPKKVGTLRRRIPTIIGIVLCVILVPILIMNITLIVKSYVNKDEVPTFGGKAFFIVLTDSMYPDIKSGDLIICRTEKPENVKVGDVISFFDPKGNGTSVVTHRVTKIEKLADGGLQFRTMGDHNNTPDDLPVPAEKFIAVYEWRIPGAGNVAMFMQTTAGLIVCVILPLVLLVGYDLIRRRHYAMKKQKDTDALLAELESLKAEQAKKAQTLPQEGSSSGGEQSPENSSNSEQSQEDSSSGGEQSDDTPKNEND